MKVKELIEELKGLNPEAEVFVIVHNRNEQFSMAWGGGGGEGEPKEECEEVDFYVDRLCQNEKEEQVEVKKDLAYYMSLPYKVKYVKILKEEGGGWLAYIPQLGEFAFRGDGETKEEALKSLNFIKEELFKDYLRDGVNIPEPE